MISRYDPFREALSLRRAIDQLFEQSFVHPRWLGEHEGAFAPMDVYETDQGYEVRVALPGVKPEDIDLVVHQNTLMVKGHYETRTAEGKEPKGTGTKEERRGNWMMREISSGTFERSITFPRPVDVDKVQTSYEHGILTVTLPITEASRPRHISISGTQGQQRIPVEAGRS